MDISSKRLVPLAILAALIASACASQSSTTSIAETTAQVQATYAETAESTVALSTSESTPSPTSPPTSTRTPTDTPTATPTDTPTNTPTATATDTPTPEPIHVEGILFLDANGNGIQDNAAFECPSYVPAFPPPLSLDHFFPGACDTNNAGEIVVVSEPGLSDFITDINGNVATTNNEGHYELKVPADTPMYMTISDPHAGEPPLEMRYVNVWKGVVEIDGVELNDAQAHSIRRGMNIVPGRNDFGLMQGNLTLPFGKESPSCIEGTQWYDWDFAKGIVMNFWGSTERSNQGGPDGRTYDGHSGTDYFCEVGTPSLASAPGYIEDINEGGNLSLNLYIDHAPLTEDYGMFWSIYGHLLDTTADIGQKVYRGQEIAHTGISGTQVAHLHFNPLTGNGYPERPDAMDYIEGGMRFHRDSYAPPIFISGVTPPDSIQDSSPYSMWTVYNLPVFPGN